MREWKETEFGKIPNDWSYESLENFFDLITYGFTNPMPTEKEGPYMLTTKDIFDGKVQYKSARRTSKDAFEKLLTAKSRPQLNDILITKDGSIGRVAIVDRDNICISQSVALIRPNHKILPLFLKYLLEAEQYQKLIDIDATGSTIQHIYITKINKMLIGVPNKDTQKRIVDCIHSIQTKIDLLHRQNTTLEAMAETLFRQWFVEEAKEDWEEKKLDDLVTITSSKRIFYSEYVSYGVPFYRSKEIIELHNSGSTNSDLYIPEDRFKEIEEKFGAPLEGDILLTSVGTLGVPYRVKKNDRFYFKDGNLTWFKDFKGITSEIIYCWLKSQIGKDQLDSISIGSTQAALTISGLKELKLTIPPKSKVEELNAQLKTIYPKIESNQTQIRTLTTLRDTLLPKLMSGEVRVKY